jgi:hypothetical protein
MNQTERLTNPMAVLHRSHKRNGPDRVSDPGRSI